jgi:CheY-like chemotaxis protein
MNSLANKNSKSQILVVEDDRDIRDLMVELLQESSYDVLVANNGQEAINTLLGGARPNLILLDLMMPVKDGFTFRKEQLENPEIADIPVVVMTADGHVGNKVSKISCDVYVKKPIDVDNFLKVVSDSLHSK